MSSSKGPDSSFENFRRPPFRIEADDEDFVHDEFSDDPFNFDDNVLSPTARAALAELESRMSSDEEENPAPLGARAIPDGYRAAADAVGDEHMHAYLDARDAYFSEEGYGNDDLRKQYHMQRAYIADHLPSEGSLKAVFAEADEHFRSERGNLRRSAEDRSLSEATRASHFAPGLEDNFLKARSAYFAHIDKRSWSAKEGASGKTENELREQYVRARNSLLFAAASASDPSAGFMRLEEARTYRAAVAKLLIEKDRERLNGRHDGADDILSLMRSDVLANAYGRSLSRSYPEKSAAALENFLDPELGALKESVGTVAYALLVEARRAYYAAKIAEQAHDFESGADRKRIFRAYERMRESILKAKKPGYQELVELDKALDAYAKQGPGKPNGTRKLRYALLAPPVETKPEEVFEPVPPEAWEAYGDVADPAVPAKEAPANAPAEPQPEAPAEPSPEEPLPPVAEPVPPPVDNEHERMRSIVRRWGTPFKE